MSTEEPIEEDDVGELSSGDNAFKKGFRTEVIVP